MTDERTPTEQAPATPVKPTGILPGLAAILIFLLFVSMFTGFQILRTTTGSASIKYSILAVCTLVVIGVFGTIRLRRWGWALVCGGCVLGSLGNMLAFRSTGIGGYLVQGLFSLLFFLYLVRPEVRDRLR